MCQLEQFEFDVVVIGGSIAGASAAHLLRQRDSEIRVLVIEQCEKFNRKVGEASVEVGAYFLGRGLGLIDYLNSEHLVKQGLRFYFNNSDVTNLEGSSELGGKFLSRVPSYLLDRAELDDELLRRTADLDVTVWRPASVKSIDLTEGGPNHLVATVDGVDRQVSCRWVIDASGVAAFVGRKRGWIKTNTDHPLMAAWGRFKGVEDLDGLALRNEFPKWSSSTASHRGLATTHVMGDGWWGWFIRLKGGDTSVGIVLDQRLASLPNEGRLVDRMRGLLEAHPVAKRMLRDATPIDGDVHLRKNLAYTSDCYAEDGLAIVGDAAGFIDPFYSMGLDWTAFTVVGAVELILAQRRGEPIAHEIKMHNNYMRNCSRRWFEAIYRDKYEYLGDFDLLRSVVLMDLGLYYLGVASIPYTHGTSRLRKGLFTRPTSMPFYHLMRLYNRRFVAMARSRRARGVFGKRNAGRRYLFDSFTFSISSARLILVSLVRWCLLEVTEGWRTWLRSPQSNVATQAKASVDQEAEQVQTRPHRI